MSHCYYHALSSVKRWGGVAADYLPVHQWFDESKAILADPRHRALRHHAEGILMAERLFGISLTNADGRVVIPSFADWARLIAPAAWVTRGNPKGSPGLDTAH